VAALAVRLGSREAGCGDLVMEGEVAMTNRLCLRDGDRWRLAEMLLDWCACQMKGGRGSEQEPEREMWRMAHDWGIEDEVEILRNRLKKAAIIKGLANL
jgi:hypothetical protein